MVGPPSRSCAARLWTPSRLRVPRITRVSGGGNDQSAASTRKRTPTRTDERPAVTPPPNVGIMFFVVTVGLIEAGYVDIARSNVQTTEGKLATIAHWRRYAALVRTLSEYFRLKCVLHAQFTIAVGEPFIVGALITAVSCGAAVMLFFFRRYSLSIAVSIAAILTLLLYKIVEIGC